MIKQFFKYAIGKSRHKECVLGNNDIVGCEKIFFAVFSRYGDGIISFKIIREFAALYPDKQYLLFTTSQLVPYAKEILNDGVEVVGVNKRNPLSLIPSILKLKNFDADLGFNPWSHGDDAEFFVSFAKKYSIFKRFRQWGKAHNLYARVREYLGLEPKVLGNAAVSLPDNAQNIILVPFSTDTTKSLDKEMTKQLISRLQELYKNAKITICGFANELKGIEGLQKFYFSKSSSNEFLALLKSSDLFVGVDAGPLHIANAMGIQSIGIFGPTAPETIVDFDWSCTALRDPSLGGVFCYVDRCKKPMCIYKAVNGFSIAQFVDMVSEEKIECKVGGL